MSQNEKIVLLSCGSFNPPTFMHLRMFEIAKDSLEKHEYTVLGGIISPVHDGYEKKELASAEHRCKMIKLALKSSSWVKLSNWECNQESWTPTRQVLQYHQNALNSFVYLNKCSPQKRQRRDDITWLPDKCTTESLIKIKLLVGGDLLESFATPGLWADDDLESIIAQHGIVVITRDQSNPLKFIYESDLLTKYQKNIHIVNEWIANEISSTKVRRAIRRGDSIKYVIPDSVISYIQQYMLYSTSDDKYNKNSNKIISTPNDDSNKNTNNTFATPSPSDVSMLTPTTYLNDINLQQRNIPPIRPQTEGSQESIIEVDDEKDDKFDNNETTRVEIKITKDGIKVISDKETTV